ncbi:hypothetical protein, partial [Achromobacter sp.]
MDAPMSRRIDIVDAAPQGVRGVASVCCYCGTGCGVRVETRDGAVLR